MLSKHVHHYLKITRYELTDKNEKQPLKKRKKIFSGGKNCTEPITLVDLFITWTYELYCGSEQIG